MRFALLLALAVETLALGAEILNAVLPEDLSHPPRVGECVRQLFAAQAPAAFQEVLYFLGPYHGESRKIAQFSGRTKQSKFAFKLQFTSDSNWRYFHFPHTESLVLGMYSRSMHETAQVIPTDGSPVFSIDLNPCRRLLGR